MPNNTKGIMEQSIIELLEKLEGQPKPVILSRSNYDFIEKFIAPEPMPDYVQK